MQASKQIRIKDIATRCNVSAGTVDRVLHNRSEVSPETRIRIMEAIDDLDYRPNILASSLASKKAHVFATLLPAALSKDGYWSKPVIGVRQRASELQHFGIHFELFTFDQFSSADFDQQAEKIMSLDPEGVLLAPFFVKESKQFISRLRQKKIPFVFIDSEITNQGQLAYVGQNSFQCGLLSARLMSMMVHPSKPLFVVHFAKEMDNQNHLIQREKGFYEWFRKNEPGRVIRTLEICIPETPDSNTQLKAVLSENDSAGVYVSNSRVFLAASLIEKSGYKNIHLIGHDLLKKNADFLKKGMVDFLLCQRPEKQGYNSVDILFQAVIQRSQVQQHYYTPIDIIAKENINFYKEFK